jgi:hypothetical protein
MDMLGQAPPEAAAAVVAFGDGTARRMEPQTDGWFVGVLTWPDCQGWDQLPDWVHIAALDDNGVVLAERDLEPGY